MQQHSFDAFVNAVRALMERVSNEKGYNDHGVDGPNPLDDFCAKWFPTHRLGEVVYKCVRFQRKRDIEDLEKAAAWLFLEWRAAKRAQSVGQSTSAAQAGASKHAPVAR